jgi:hypothetical protein
VAPNGPGTLTAQKISRSATARIIIELAVAEKNWCRIPALQGHRTGSTFAGARAVFDARDAEKKGTFEMRLSVFDRPSSMVRCAPLARPVPTVAGIGSAGKRARGALHAWS